MFDLSALPGDFQAFIFDCDGTLVDTPVVYAKAWAIGLRPSGIEMDRAWYMAHAGRSEVYLMDAFESEFGVILRREEVVRLMREEFVRRAGELQEIGAIVSIARKNHGRVPMAVASGGSAPIVVETLRATGLRPLFDAVVTIDDVKNGKPAPDLFLEAANRLGARAGRCLVFEDSREGLEAAHRAGMQAVDVLAILKAPG